MNNQHELNIKLLRKLANDVFFKTKQGHPGMGISAIPLVYSIYMNMNFYNEDSNWINRDRFVLSGGHGIMSVYVMFYYLNIISYDDLLKFRQKDSITPGHPEYNLTPHIDCSTGPLGQGIANAVGMAIAEKYLSNKFNNKYNEEIINHYTYVIVGDGDLQEGVSYESMSLAGKLNLDKLIVLHDSNKYQLESSVQNVNIENLKLRVESMGWNYIKSNSSFEEINKNIKLAKVSNKPTFIEVNTIIGEGFSVANSYNAHGFIVDEKEHDNFINYWNTNDLDDKNIFNFLKQNIIEKNKLIYNNWKNKIDKLKNKNTNFKKYFELFEKKELINYEELLLNSLKLSQDKASRVYAGEILKYFENLDHNLFILSPDISKSTNIKFNKELFNNDPTQPYLQLGIREFAMGCIQNGISLHSNIKCISSSFLVFSDYFKSAIRMSSLMKLQNIYIFTHDSVQVGSDGPTHQPIEQLAMLRHIPNLSVIRPADEYETLWSFIFALNSKKPIALILSRQNLKSNLTKRTKEINNGGYLVYSTNKNQDNDFIICSSGSELELSYELQKKLETLYNCNVSIYSVPNLNKFINSKELRNKLKVRKGIICLEASNDSSWYKLSQYSDLLFIGIDRFGKSMDGNELYKEYGMNVENIIKVMKEEKKWI